MDGTHGLSGWRWLFIFDGVITLPMALWGMFNIHPTSVMNSTYWLPVEGYFAIPDLPSSTRVRWLKASEKELALQRMKEAGKDLDEPITWNGIKRVLSKWHFWVYSAYYTYVSWTFHNGSYKFTLISNFRFFICSENIGGYMNLWLKSLKRFVSNISNIFVLP
jgi:ACS family pantothenate transporter-like MFS transporter